MEEETEFTTKETVKYDKENFNDKNKQSELFKQLTIISKSKDMTAVDID